MLSNENTADRGVAKPADNILSFGRPLNSEDPAAVALNLVAQAADLMRAAEDSATEKTVRAEALANKAIDKLKTAYDRLRISESRRADLELEIDNLNGLREKALVSLQELEKRMEQMVSRLKDTEARLSLAQQRGDRAEDAVKCVEEAIRTRILAHLGGKIFGKLSTMNDMAA